VCVSKMIYFARPDSRFFGEIALQLRHRIGIGGGFFARQKNQEWRPIIVIGVPDSGIPAAIGFLQGQLHSPMPMALCQKSAMSAAPSSSPPIPIGGGYFGVKLNPLPIVLAGKRWG